MLYSRQERLAIKYGLDYEEADEVIEDENDCEEWEEDED